MNNDHATVRQPGTEKLYEQKVQQLERRIQRRRKERHVAGENFMLWEEPVTLTGLARFFVAEEGNWQAATMRVYRAALLHHFAQFDTLEAREAELLVTFEDEDGEERAHRLERNRLRRKAAKKSEPRTSTKKLKTLSRDKLSQLIKRLQATSSQYGEAAADWLTAGALTGLRPCEWQHAEIVEVEDKTILRVKNAKYTHNRAHGQYRSLDISDVDGPDLTTIRRHISRIKNYASRGAYSQIYKNCRDVLLRASRRVLGNSRRTATLYLGRHLFASDAKNDHDRDEVAALLGHASNETASLHYGRRRYGQRGRLKLKASSDDVAAVKKRNPPKAIKKTPEP